MEVTKKEILEIATKFNLGKVISYKIIKGGLVNFNYVVKTETGKYIFRIPGDNTNKKIKHLKLQFKILNFLKGNNFPYSVPIPLKTKDSKIILRINGKIIWAYKMLNGKNKISNINIIQIKQIAKALATYHKYIQKRRGQKMKDDSKERIQKGFKKMKKIQGKEESDKLAKKYASYFENIFKKIKNLNFSRNLLYVHSDFDSSNILFQNNKLIAIIDFDETNYAPRIFDVAISVRDSCRTQGKLDMKKAEIFLREYKKIISLTKEEEKQIIPIILQENINFFVWAYSYMKKDTENKNKYMKEMITLTEDIIKNNKTF